MNKKTRKFFIDYWFLAFLIIFQSVLSLINFNKPVIDNDSVYYLGIIHQYFNPNTLFDKFLWHVNNVLVIKSVMLLLILCSIYFMYLILSKLISSRFVVNMSMLIYFLDVDRVFISMPNYIDKSIFVFFIFMLFLYAMLEHDNYFALFLSLFIVIFVWEGWPVFWVILILISLIKSIIMYTNKYRVLVYLTTFIVIIIFAFLKFKNLSSSYLMISELVPIYIFPTIQSLPKLIGVMSAICFIVIICIDYANDRMNKIRNIQSVIILCTVLLFFMYSVSPRLVIFYLPFYCAAIGLFLDKIIKNRLTMAGIIVLGFIVIMIEISCYHDIYGMTMSEPVNFENITVSDINGSCLVSDWGDGYYYMYWLKEHNLSQDVLFFGHPDIAKMSQYIFSRTNNSNCTYIYNENEISLIPRYRKLLHISGESWIETDYVNWKNISGYYVLVDTD